MFHRRLHKRVVAFLLLALCPHLVDHSLVMAQALPLAQHISSPVLRGIKIDPNNPLRLEFIIDTPKDTTVSKEEFSRLVGYFMAVLTIDEKDLWVNLSPYEKDRVIDPVAAETEFGKGLLTQDYVLKQLAASLTNPQSSTGKDYWRDINGAQTSDLSKVWIMPDQAQIYENGNAAYITQASLKVRAEDAPDSFKKNILPQISRDVNGGDGFIQLRQMYHSFLLASWFKSRLKESLYKYYINQNKVNGIAIDDKDIKDKIYNQYVEAFKRGVYDCIKKERVQNKVVTRRYFSGGIAGFDKAAVDAFGSTTAVVHNPAVLPRTGIVAVTGTVDVVGDKASGAGKVAGMPAHYLSPEQLALLREKLPALAKYKVLYNGKISGGDNMRVDGYDPIKLINAGKMLHARGKPGVEPYPHDFVFDTIGLLDENELSRWIILMDKFGKVTPVIILHNGLTAQEIDWAINHDTDEIALWQYNSGLLEKLAKKHNIEVMRLVHMLVAAREAIDWVRAGNEGLMPIHESMLSEKDRKYYQDIVDEDRVLQKMVVGEWYPGYEKILLEYQQRFSKRAAQLLDNHVTGTRPAVTREESASAQRTRRSGAGKIAGTEKKNMSFSGLVALKRGESVFFDPDLPLPDSLIDTIGKTGAVNIFLGIKLLRERGYTGSLLPVVVDKKMVFLNENELSRWVQTFGVPPFIVIRPDLKPEEIAWALVHDTQESVLQEAYGDNEFAEIAGIYNTDLNYVDARSVAHIIQSAREAIDWVKSDHSGLMPVHESMLQRKKVSGDGQYFTDILKEDRGVQNGVIGKWFPDDVDQQAYQEYQTRFKARAGQVGGIVLETNITLKAGSKTIELKVTPQMIEAMQSSAIGYQVVSVGEQRSLKEVLGL